MGDVNLEIKLTNLDERVIKIEESGGGSGGDGYITSVSNDFNVVNKKLSLSNNVTTKLSKIDDKIDNGVISDDYNELKTYVAGEYCIYNNSLWKCLLQHNGQTPTEGTYWTNVKVAKEIVSVNSSLTDLDSRLFNTLTAQIIDVKNIFVWLYIPKGKTSGKVTSINALGDKTYTVNSPINFTNNYYGYIELSEDIVNVLKNYSCLAFTEWN